MTFIGKKISEAIPELSRAKVISEQEYEIKNTDGTPSGERVRDQDLDLDGDGKTDVRTTRWYEENGRYTDEFEVENNINFKHDRVTFFADPAGSIRSEAHFDFDP